jgi:hypothetical protein
VQPDLDAGSMLRLNLNLTPEEAVGLMLRTGSPASATVQTFVAAVRAQASAQRRGARQRVR